MYSHSRVQDKFVSSVCLMIAREFGARIEPFKCLSFCQCILARQQKSHASDPSVRLRRMPVPVIIIEPGAFVFSFLKKLFISGSSS